MHIQHIPLLQIQRDLHEKPRNMDRFYEYLRTIFGGDVSEEILVKITGVRSNLLEAPDQRVGSTSRPVGLATLITADEKER